MNYWYFIKIKSFYIAKETVIKTKRPLTEGEKIFTSVLSDKGLVSKIYKELLGVILYVGKSNFNKSKNKKINFKNAKKKF